MKSRTTQNQNFGCEILRLATKQKFRQRKSVFWQQNRKSGNKIKIPATKMRTGNKTEIPATKVRVPATKQEKRQQNQNSGNKNEDWQQNRNSGNESPCSGNKTGKTATKSNFWQRKWKLTTKLKFRQQTSIPEQKNVRIMV
ncbi:hypothetical protein [Bacillus sp. CECT 9360]|uniref:hypothetical protein n=1 Tax=Bacillus sp. CECT 9360 TaxID=2845821 RepID=UPI001E35B440|nr:hypothetical protein [Bacillus sp. CECT 9360]